MKSWGCSETQEVYQNTFVGVPIFTPHRGKCDHSIFMGLLLKVGKQSFKFVQLVSIAIEVPELKLLPTVLQT